jgi:outer membrane protein OmpA-like peptidoglycan-associated protein
MKSIKLLLLACIMMFVSNTFAQNKDYPWLVGFGTHGPQMTINDDGFFREYFRFKNWNLLPGIGKIWVDRAIGNSFTVGTHISLGIADRRPTITNENKFFLDWDINAKYKFANGYILNTKCWFDPYIIGSAGLTHFDKRTNPSFGLGAGTNIWLTPKFGVNIETSYNKTVGKVRTPSYMHHAIGFVVRFGKGADKDKDGIADFEDACPDVVGLVALGGCPDADGDGIMDNADKCPTVAGIIAFAGCPDTDGDGIMDSEDGCPRDAGSKEMNGCPDRDGDGVMDKDDQCPDVKGSIAMNGCPDSDGDGVMDKNDACPTVFGSTKTNGCPDRDNDGIADKEDKCPDVAGVAERQGCPKMDESKRQEIQNKIAFAAKSIQFETGKDIIKPISYKELDEVVAIMKEYDFVKFVIAGHTDNLGNVMKNMDLSARRAGAVMNYFVAKGISPSRLTSNGYGDTRPIATNATAEGRQQNRRVDITLKD